MKGDVMEPELINMPNNGRGVTIERADLRSQFVISADGSSITPVCRMSLQNRESQCLPVF